MSRNQLTPVQLQFAYRLAVQSSLVAFYRQSNEQAERLVRDWWHRLSRLEDIESEMFLHDEALATAADLVHAGEVSLTDSVRKRYLRILHDSTRAAVAGEVQIKKVKSAMTLKQMAG